MIGPLSTLRPFLLFVFDTTRTSINYYLNNLDLYNFYLTNKILFLPDLSPYQRKKPKESEKEPEALTTLLATGSLELKEEPNEEEEYNMGNGTPSIF